MRPIRMGLLLPAAASLAGAAESVRKDLGTLAQGRYADVIAVLGDVLTHIDLLQSVDVVVKNGVRVR